MAARGFSLLQRYARSVYSVERSVLVRNVGYCLRREDFGEYFQKFGQVKQAYLPLHENGSGPLVGFVEFTSADHKEAAVQHEDHNLQGRKLIVQPLQRRVSNIDLTQEWYPDPRLSHNQLRSSNQSSEAESTGPSEEAKLPF